MPKTLSKSDPALVASVQRFRRVEQVWGVLLIVLGGMTEAMSFNTHPIGGLPLIAVGLYALRFSEPALLAAVAALVGLSITPSINPRLTILGPDPLRLATQLNTLELVALVAGKALVVLTAANQFLAYRLLYGTARATSDDPELAIIPPMVENRTTAFARWARRLGALGLVAAGIGFLLVLVDPTAQLAQILAEMGGALATVAISLGIGAAFSPTDDRPAALSGIVLGLAGYFVAAAALLRVPGA